MIIESYQHTLEGLCNLGALLRQQVKQSDHKLLHVFLLSQILVLIFCVEYQKFLAESVDELIHSLL